MKKAALGAFGMASLNALGVGSGENGNEAPHQVCNFSVNNCLVIINHNYILSLRNSIQYYIPVLISEIIPFNLRYCTIRLTNKCHLTHYLTSL